MRQLARLLLAVSVVGVASCGGGNHCDASSCTGCCDSNEVCQPGVKTNACGANAAMCTDCSAGMECVNSACTTSTGMGGGSSVGGGSATGGGSSAGGGAATGGGSSAQGGGSSAGGGSATGGGAPTGGGTAAGGGTGTGGGGVPAGGGTATGGGGVPTGGGAATGGGGVPTGGGAATGGGGVPTGGGTAAGGGIGTGGGSGVIVDAGCSPGASFCADPATRRTCSDAGTPIDRSCLVLSDGGADPAGFCSSGACVNGCSAADALSSSLGCDFWGSVLDNAVDTLFCGGDVQGQGTLPSDFAFVAVNPSNVAVSVSVQRSFSQSVQQVATVSVPPRSDASRGTAIIQVPWQSISTPGAFVSQSGEAPYGYHVTSLAPIALYQLNPLEAHKRTATVCTAAVGQPDCACNESGNFDVANCAFDPASAFAGNCVQATDGGKQCSYDAFTSDSSLVLPTHLLGTDYIGLSSSDQVFTTSASGAAPYDSTDNGYLQIIATQNGTVVTVTSSAGVPGFTNDAGQGFTTISKGQLRVFNLNMFDVLQLASGDAGAATQCVADPFNSAEFTCTLDNDLSGTQISATHPIAVFGGSACTLSPISKAACDHVEEQLLPTTLLGKQFVAVRSAAPHLMDGSIGYVAPDHWKLTASCGASQCPLGTLISFSAPPVATDVVPPNRCLTGSLATNDCRLPLGVAAEFASTANFTITADHAIAVGQLFPGGSDQGVGPQAAEGDPSLVITPSVDRWRAHYTVLASPTYASNYLGIAYETARVAQVLVDGVPISGFTVVSGTAFSAKNHPVGPGAHSVDIVSSDGAGAGVTVFGYDAFVSYGHLGGL